jgi:hypothetical protein
MVKFKKSTKKRAAIRSQTGDDDEGEECSALDAIQLTQKKQKLVQSTLYKRGLDTTKMWKPEPAMAVAEKSVASDVQKTLFKKAFSSTEHGPTETIMEQKHLCAMEEFINKKLSKQCPNGEEEDMESRVADIQQAAEADMGAGGTMLGGTGIAEVILPVDKRLEAVKQTEELRASLPGTFGKSTASSAGYHLEQSDVRGVAGSFSQNFKNLKQQQPLSNTFNGMPSLSEQGTRADDDRLGFQAARHAAPAKEFRPQYQRANDDRLLKQFIKKERAKR